MDKEEFLKRLKNKLAILDEKEVDDILDEYSEFIDEKVKSGTSEKDAIKEFGDLSVLATDILSAYKVNKNYTEDKINYFIDEIIDNVKYVFNKIVKILSNGKGMDILKLVIYIAIVLLITAIFKIPFTLLENLLQMTFDSLPDYIERVFDTIISVVINLSYILLSFIFVMKMLKEKLLSHYIVDKEVVREKETKKKSKTKNSKNEEDVIIEREVEKKIVYKNERTFLDSIGDLFLIIIKIMSVFILIPSIFGMIFSSIGIAGIVLFSVKYVFIFGPLLICIGGLVGCIWLTEIIFRFISNKSGSFMKSFIMFISAIVICGLGIGVSIMEFTNFRFDEFPYEETHIKNYTFDLAEINRVQCNKCYSINSIVDNTMKDNDFIIKTYGYNFEMTSYEELYNNNKLDKINIYSYNKDTSVINTLFEGLKKGKLYDFDSMDSKLRIEIFANQNTLNSLNIEK